MANYVLVMKVGLVTDDKLVPRLDTQGSICGFNMKDGSALRPIIAFEHDFKGEGDQFQDFSTSDELKSVGIIEHDYGDIEILEEEEA